MMSWTVWELIEHLELYLGIHYVPAIGKTAPGDDDDGTGRRLRWVRADTGA